MSSERPLSKQVILYLPVVHAGYIKFVQEQEDANEILVLGASFHELFPQLRKDIRAVEPVHAARMIRPFVPGTHVRVVEINDFYDVVFADILVMPEEDIMHELSEQYQLETKHEVCYESAFLRWDRSRAEMERDVEEDEILSEDSLHRMLAGLATVEAAKSPDWWRQVGAVAWKDGEILYSAFNTHQPSPYAAVVEGDPRGNFRGGVRTDLSLAEHAEAWIIGRAAYDGVSLKNATIAVNTFPCPNCARLIVTAGIDQILFQTGYALVEGDEILRSAGIKIVRVAPN